MKGIFSSSPLRRTFHISDDMQCCRWRAEENQENSESYFCGTDEKVQCRWNANELRFQSAVHWHSKIFDHRRNKNQARDTNHFESNARQEQKSVFTRHYSVVWINVAIESGTSINAWEFKPSHQNWEVDGGGCRFLWIEIRGVFVSIENRRVWAALLHMYWHFNEGALGIRKWYSLHYFPPVIKDFFP